MGKPRTCPYCNVTATIRDHDIQKNWYQYFLNDNGDEQRCGLETYIITCPSEGCRKSEIYIERNIISESNNWIVTQVYQLEPQASIKPFPKYIPDQILQDYKEAKLILNLSPKASATLARRCLQNMIRDFFGIQGKKSLHHEIEAIEDKVDSAMYQAIMALKSIGNIGAHPEKDINLIVDIEPIEATQLVELIEILIEDWYIARETRNQKIKKIQEINQQKQDERKGNVSP